MFCCVQGPRLSSCALSHMHQSTSRMRLASFRAAISIVVALVVISDVSLAFVARGASISRRRSSTAAVATTINSSASARRQLQRVVGSMNSSATSTEQGATRKEKPSPPSIVKGVLFDMDGTLTDSDTLHFEAYRETFLKVTPQFNHGEAITREYYDDWMSGNSNPAIVEKLFPEMPADEQTALWKSKEDIYRLISTKMTPLEGLLAFFERCQAAGLAMILVTNAPRLDAIHTLKVLGLSHRFEETMVIGYECARAKPHPDPYLEGLARIGLSADDCVAFEDSVNGVGSAVAAGIYTIGVGEGSQKRLRGTGAGLCVTDYLDTELCSVLGLVVNGR